MTRDAAPDRLYLCLDQGGHASTTEFCEAVATHI